MAETAPDITPDYSQPPRRGRFELSPLNKRRWRNFTRNRRAFWSLWIFLVLFGLSLFAEFIANDKPIMVNYRGELRMPVFTFYSEQEFGGDFPTEAPYRDIEVECLIITGGLEDCFYEPEDMIAAAEAGTIDDPGFQKGWVLWPPIPYSYDTIVDVPGVAPSPPDGNNLLGTDDTKRDVLARVIHGFRLSILFTLIVTTCASIIGIIAGAIQGYFGGWTDLIFQRILGNLGLDALDLRHHHPLRDPRPKFLVTGPADRAFWLAGAGGRGAGRIPAGAEFRICPRGPGAGGLQPHHHVPPHAAQCHGRHADHAALHHHRHHRHAGQPRLPGLRAAVLGTVSGGIDLAGQAEPASALAWLHRLLHLRDHAVASGVHF